MNIRLINIRLLANLLFVIFFFCACDEALITDKEKSEFTMLLFADSIHLHHINSTYTLEVYGSKLENTADRNFNANATLFNLYSLIVSKTPEMPFRTSFEVKYLDTKDSYKESLQELSSIVKTKQSIDQMFHSLINTQRIDSNMIYIPVCGTKQSRVDVTGLEWSSLKNSTPAFSGYINQQITVCDKPETSTVFMYSISDATDIWIYTMDNLSSLKVVGIIKPNS